jgi:hypothetical protein
MSPGEEERGGPAHLEASPSFHGFQDTDHSALSRKDLLYEPLGRGAWDVNSQKSRLAPSSSGFHHLAGSPQNEEWEVDCRSE